MLTRNSAAITKTDRKSAWAIGLLLCASAHIASAAGVDSVDGFLGSAALYGFYREAQERAPLIAERTVNLNGIRLPVDDHALSFGSTTQSGILARLHHAIESDQSEPAVLLGNSDAVVRTKVRLPVGRQWLGFVYADMGATDSELRWQGLAGIRSSHGFGLLGGWRHVTYRFSPGMGLDSLAFNGPFVGATLAW